MKKRLFNIHDYILRNDTIVVEIEDNDYTDNCISIPVHAFVKYLLRHDRLYFESHDFSTGQLVTKSYHLTFDNYWDEMEREYIEQDLYDFIVSTCIDFARAIEKFEKLLSC